MITTRTTEPTEEPVTLEEAKRHLRVDLDLTDDDLQIETMIQAAREEAEQFLRGSIMPQTWTGYLDRFPAYDEIPLPFPPLVSVAFVKYVDLDGVTQTLSPSIYEVDKPGRRIFLRHNQSWPSVRCQRNAVTIEFETGYADAASVPAKIKQAMLLMIGEMYEYREESVVGTVVAKMPNTAERLLWPLRDMRGV